MKALIGKAYYRSIEKFSMYKYSESYSYRSELLMMPRKYAKKIETKGVH